MSTICWKRVRSLRSWPSGWKRSDYGASYLTTDGNGCIIHYRRTWMLYVTGHVGAALLPSLKACKAVYADGSIWSGAYRNGGSR